MIKQFLKLAVMAALCLPAFAQYTVITPASQFITINLPAGAVWQVGNVADNKWSADQPVTLASGISFTAWYSELASYPYIAKFADPDPTKAEVFRIKQTSVAQTIWLTDRSGKVPVYVPVAVPALVVTTPPPSPFVTYLITCTATATVSSTDPSPTTLPITGSSCTAVKQP